MKNFVIIGSGVMGSGIAGQFANAGFKVTLLDIIPQNATDRNILAKQAIAKINSAKPENIIPGNLEDDLAILQSADWVVEVIIEKLSLKQTLYQKLEQYCHPNCIISSNTSTIPLQDLIEGRNKTFKKNFLITHFFNPPRYMQLLELIVSNFTEVNVIKKISDFIDIHLGKTIIKSNDTPGFIANRIGCYWLEAALTLAIEMDLSVETADSLIGKPLGVPATGVFGLYDLIGIDVMKLIAKSLSEALNKNDDFKKISKPHALIDTMIKDGFIGRKGKGGFYKIIKDNNGNKIKQVIDLKTGIYAPFIETPSLRTSIKELFNNNEYVFKVLSKTLSYAASLIPEVTDNLSNIDQAMKLGYNWKYGPFELIDLIGPSHFKQKLKQQNLQAPEILTKVQNNTFYQADSYFTGNSYAPVQRPEGVIYLKDFYNKEIICQNDSAKIINMQDIAVIDFTNKMAIMDHNIFHLIVEFFDKHIDKFKAFIIYGGQTDFSAGGNLKFMLENADNPKLIDEYLQLGQKTMMLIKYSKIPVVSVLKGVALGGGSEFLLHSSSVVSHLETISGLVETSVGLIPGWGGCKEMILRSNSEEELVTSFKNILTARTSSSAYELQEMFKINDFQVVMNINRLLQQAKATALKPKTETIHLKKSRINIDWEKIISNMNLNGYDQTIAYELASIFVENNLSEEELLTKERSIFIKLLSNQATKDRIGYMLKNKKKLKN